jgi:hypothetical protein
MNDQSPQSRDLTIWEALGIAWDLLVSVVVTATVFALLGVYGDRWLGTKYAVKIAAFALMAIIEYRIILVKGRRIAKRLDERSVGEEKKDAAPHEHPPAS